MTSSPKANSQGRTSHTGEAFVELTELSLLEKLGFNSRLRPVVNMERSINGQTGKALVNTVGGGEGHERLTLNYQILPRSLCAQKVSGPLSYTRPPVYDRDSCLKSQGYQKGIFVWWIRRPSQETSSPQLGSYSRIRKQITPQSRTLCSLGHNCEYNFHSGYSLFCPFKGSWFVLTVISLTFSFYSKTLSFCNTLTCRAKRLLANLPTEIANTCQVLQSSLTGRNLCC